MLWSVGWSARLGRLLLAGWLGGWWWWLAQEHVGSPLRADCPSNPSAHTYSPLMLLCRRVVNSRGTEKFEVCEKDVEAMRRCLRRQGLYPFG